MRSPQTGARACALRPPPVKLDADGQALHTAPHVPHAGGEKKLQSFNAPSCNSPALP
jgi:hypothetical protein